MACQFVTDHSKENLKRLCTSFQLQWCLYPVVIILLSGIMSLSNVKQNQNNVKVDLGSQTEECLEVF